MTLRYGDLDVSDDTAFLVERLEAALDRLSGRLQEAVDVFERLGLTDEQRHYLALDRKARAEQ